MMYKMIDVELTKRLRPIKLADNASGLAVTARDQGRALGFFMLERRGPCEFGVEELAAELTKRLGWKVVQEHIRRELGTAPHVASSRPSISVAICTKDRPALLERCLGSVLKATSSPGGEIEILVIDNAPSTNATKLVVAAQQRIRYIVEPRPGLDFARNTALRAAKGDLIAYVDDDVTVDVNWLKGLYEAWETDPHAACFTGLILPYELATEAQVLCEQRGGFRKGFEKVRYGRSCPVSRFYPGCAGIFGVGANMAFRRDVLVALGGFDEALDTGAPLPGGGDHDAFYRIVRAGYTLIYEPQYLVYHEHRKDLSRLRHMYWTWGLSFMAFSVKNYRLDLEARSVIRDLIKWWFKDQIRQLFESLCGRHVLPPKYILAELSGGGVGLLGEYDRSQRRIERINAQHSDHARAL
jgi:glycosyltransferase involved in cell wall biosynthesis